MGTVGAIRNYIETMIRDSEPGYKIMLMDKETTSIVSLVMGMSEAMKQEVYLFEQLESMSSGEAMTYLKCVVFVRPTPHNVALLCRELQSPRYGAYYVYFSNAVSAGLVKRLAEADEQELVRDVREVYADYLALAPHFASVGLPLCVRGGRWGDGCLRRAAAGVTAVLFSLSLLPQVRYQANSSIARELAEEVQRSITVEGSVVANTGNTTASAGDSLLLVLDRREDPVTPLLHQWTYEAMVHELLGVEGGRVSLAGVAGISEELKEVLMIPSQDEFYLKNMYLNYGEIGQTIKTLMEEYQSKLSKQQKVESISDMKHFVQNYPQFKQMSGTVSKHVTVVGRLSQLVGERRLLDVSECQQNLVCGQDHSGSLTRVRALVCDPGIATRDAATLVMLYALRYQSHPNNDTRALVAALGKRPGASEASQQVAAILQYGAERQAPLFDALPQDANAFRKLLLRGVKGVDNVYTQHQPRLVDTVEQVAKGSLKTALFPCCQPNSPVVSRPAVVVVAVAGGATYEEACAVARLNAAWAGQRRAVLVGTSVLGSAAFLQEVAAAVQRPGV